MTPAAIPGSPADRTLMTTRAIAAKPAEVYAAFVSGERLARWWGPKGFRNTFEVFEPRVGGTWRFVMHGPDGRDYPNESRFDELVPGERVVIRHVVLPHFTLTATFAAEGDGTRVTWCQTFETKEVCEAVRRIAGPGNEENLDRLEAELVRVRG
jgi:uncharacterized protein YndB with AHSA1/START domain